MDGVTNVWIKFDAVEVKPADGPSMMFDLPQMQLIDVAALTGGESALILDSVELPAGQYNWIRLAVNPAPADVDPAMLDYLGGDFCYATVNGNNVPITIPSSMNSGLKLNRPFIVPAGGTADFTLDFNLRQSMHEVVDGRFVMRPTLRICDNTVVGMVSGSITNLPADKTCADGVVYVFAGADATPKDIAGAATDPITTVNARGMMMGGSCGYVVPFLEPGSYTVAFTWDASLDDPAVDNTGVVNFPVAANATVTADTNTAVDIALP
jgi:hypothetical protein